MDEFAEFHTGLLVKCRHNGYFVDLFVRASNAVAIAMYEKVNAEQDDVI